MLDTLEQKVRYYETSETKAVEPIKVTLKIGPTRETVEVTNLYCNGCKYLVEERKEYEHVPEFNKTLYFCEHPEMVNSRGTAIRHTIEERRDIHKYNNDKVKTRGWCIELEEDNNA
ncbi:MAG: colanic acid biosynthesis glycosyltransferase WcaL [bacterium]|nr:colanic acid biosynthesis glycosyltransferase WcaL [bacterium]